MLKQLISPKVIDVEGNRVKTDDKLYRKESKNDSMDFSDRENNIHWKKAKNYNQEARFPTQLFTNNKNDKFKYVKTID